MRPGRDPPSSCPGDAWLAGVLRTLPRCSHGVDFRGFLSESCGDHLASSPLLRLESAMADSTGLGDHYERPGASSPCSPVPVVVGARGSQRPLSLIHISEPTRL